MGEISVAVMTMICLEAGLILRAMAQVRASAGRNRLTLNAQSAVRF
jgi:hypothetical protein